VISELAAIATIAEQNSRLGLNATIEAARAGDAVRKIAVVAGEVMKLSQDTRAATQRVTGVLDRH